MTAQDSAGQRHAPGTAVLLSISNDMVTLYKELFGRGPTRARTYWCSPDLIVIVLEDSFTPAERNMQQMGEHARLRDTRMFFQYSNKEQMCEPIERHTGRRVRSFVSGVDTIMDVHTELYLLHPETEPA